MQIKLKSFVCNQGLVRFDPSVVTVKRSSIVSQIVSFPVVLSLLVLLDLVNKSFVRRTDREQYTRSNAATARLLTLVKPAET